MGAPGAAGAGAQTLVVSSGAVYGRVAAERMPITEAFDLEPCSHHDVVRGAEQEEG